MSVSTLVLLGLAVVWAVVLLPEAVRKLSGARAGDSIRSFRQQLSSLERSAPGRRRDNVIDLRDRTSAGPARPAAPQVSPAVRRRRQEVLATLGAAAVLTLLCTVAFGGAFLFLHLLADGLLIAYVVLLNQANQANQAAASRSSLGRPASMRTVQPLGGRVQPLHGDAGMGGAVGRVTPVTARRIAN